MSAIAASILGWLAQNTLIAALLAAIVALLCRSRRLSPALRHALWLVVLLKLVTPPLVTCPWPFPVLSLGASESAAAAPTTPESGSAGATPDLTHFGAEGEDAAKALALLLADRASAAASTDTTAPMSGNQALQWCTAVGIGVWLTGFVVVAGIQIQRIRRFGNLLRQARPAPHWLGRQIDVLRRRLGIRRPGAWEVEGIHSPFVWGLGRAKLLWPQDLSMRLPTPSLRGVVAHELAHLRRRDHWVGWLLLLARCLWWWNPLFWYVSRQLRRHAELACDAWVLRVLPNGRRAYAEALIEVTRSVSRTAAPIPALGMSSGARHAFEERLTMIMQDRVPCKLPLAGILAIGCLALAALPSWSQVPAKAEPAQKPAAPTASGDFVYELQLDSVVNQVEAASPATGDRDQRLQRLEKQLQELLGEIRALRAGATAADPSKGAVQYQIWTSPPKILTGTAPTVRSFKSRNPPPPASPGAAGQQQIIITDSAIPASPAFQVFTQPGAPPAPKTPKVYPQEIRSIFTLQGEGGGNSELTLTRVTYHLPAAKANAIAGFIRDHMKASVMETRTGGDQLTVTTTPESQKAVGQLVDLILGKSSAALEKKRILLDVDDKVELLNKVEQPTPNAGVHGFILLQANPEKTPGDQIKILREQIKLLENTKEKTKREPARP